VCGIEHEQIRVRRYLEIFQGDRDVFINPKLPAGAITLNTDQP
jgi:hypothetical protein